jgi:parallel beta-helix repeat protein
MQKRSADAATRGATLRMFAPLAALLLPALAHAETTGCLGVGPLPAIISSPGTYCLNSNVSAAFAGQAINIAADDVVLDCNDHTITQTNTGNATGIVSHTDRRNVVVRHCVVDGFDVGIKLDATFDETARGNRIEDNTVARARSVGISSFGSNNRIERNRILGAAGDGAFTGIRVGTFQQEAAGNVVRDNHISGYQGVAGVSTAGIEFSNTRETSITGNILTGLYAGTGSGVIAMQGYNTSGSEISRNVILSPQPKPAPLDGGFYYGIYTPGTDAEMATVVCRDNVIGHFNSATYGCVASGNTGF